MKTDEQLFEPKEFLKIAEETQQRVQYWVLHGLVNPHHPAAGVGTSRLYSIRNLIEVAVVQALSKTGLNIKNYPHFMRNISTEVPSYFTEAETTDEPEMQMWLFIDVFGTLGSNRPYVVTFNNLKKMLIEKSEGMHPKIVLNLDFVKQHMLSRITENTY